MTTEEKGPGPMMRGRVTADSLNLRSAPGLDGLILGHLSKGQEIPVLELSADNRWLRVGPAAGVVGMDMRGWVSAKYVELNLNAPAQEEYPWMRIALSQLGVKEWTRGDNPVIQQYLRSTTLPSSLASKDETHWCSAFVNWVMEKAGLAGTDSAAARSWLNWGKKVETPHRGVITVFSRDGGGHVAFFVERQGDQIKVLGGNQSNTVSIAGYQAARLLGYRLPSSV